MPRGEGPAAEQVMVITVVKDRRGWREPSEYVSRTLTFDVPDAVLPFFGGLVPQDVDYLSRFVHPGTSEDYLILRNGLYLRVRGHVAIARGGGVNDGPRRYLGSS